MWYHVLRTLQILNLKNLFISLIHSYLTYTINVWSSTYRTILETLCIAYKWLCAHSLLLLSSPIREITSSIKKILPLDKLIDQCEGILTYKVINGTDLQIDFLNHVDVRRQIQLRNYGDLRYNYMHPHILSSLFATELSMRGMACQETKARGTTVLTTKHRLA